MHLNVRQILQQFIAAREINQRLLIFRGGICQKDKKVYHHVKRDRTDDQIKKICQTDVSRAKRLFRFFLKAKEEALWWTRIKSCCVIFVFGATHGVQLWIRLCQHRYLTRFRESFYSLDSDSFLAARKPLLCPTMADWVSAAVSAECMKCYFSCIVYNKYELCWFLPLT